MDCVHSKGCNLPGKQERQNQRLLQVLPQQAHDMLPAGVVKCVASAKHVTIVRCDTGHELSSAMSAKTRLRAG